MDIEPGHKVLLLGIVVEKLECMRAQLRAVETLHAALGGGMADPIGAETIAWRPTTADVVGNGKKAAPDKGKPKYAGKSKPGETETPEASRYKCVYPKGKKFWAFPDGINLGLFDTQEEAAAVVARHKKVPVENLLKKSALAKEAAVKTRPLKISKFDVRDAGIDPKDAEWLNEDL